MLSTPTRCNTIIYSGLPVLLALTAFGDQRLAAWGTGAAFVLAGLWLIDQLAQSRARSLARAATPIDGWLLVWLGLALVALVPLPAAWVAVISPQVYVDRRLVADMAALSGHGAAAAPGMQLIYNVPGGIDAAVRLGAGLAVFFLVIQTARSAARIQALALTLALLGLLRVAWAAVQRFGGSEALIGPSLNGRDLAGVVLVTLPFAFGLVLATRIRAWAAGPAGGAAFGLDRPRDMGIYGLAVLTIVLLILSANRAAIQSGALVAATMAALLAWRASLRRFALLPGAAALVLLLAATVPTAPGAWAGPRAAAEAVAVGRPWGAWIFAMVGDYPVMGTGLGSLADALPRYIGGPVAAGGWEQALVAGGIGFALVALAVCAVWLKTLVNTWRKRRDPDALGIGTGAIVAWIAVAVANGSALHPATPATTMALAVGAALGLIGLQRHGTGLRERFDGRLCQKPFARPRLARSVAVAIAAALLALGTWVAVAGPVDAPAAVNRSDRVPALGPTHRQEPAGSVPERIGALNLNPARSRNWMALADAFKRQEGDPYEWLNRRLPLADRCIDAGLRWAPFDAALLFEAARHWLWRSVLAGATPDAPERQQAMGRFQELFRRCLAIEPALWQKAADLVWAHYPSDAVVLAIAPQGDAALKTRILQHLVAK